MSPEAIDRRERTNRSNSKGKRQNSNSLVRRFDCLNQDVKNAINESFIFNVKARRNHITVHEAIRIYARGAPS